MAGIFISAAHKSSGKTTLSIGLSAALRAKSLHIQPFKKGPDYIDPLWLTAASGRACHNLDFNTMTQQEILQLYQRHNSVADISLIEANKGLYDGMALDGSDSNAALAKLVEAQVILVIDARGMTRGIAPLLLGYQAFDAEVQIAGVILNRVGGSRHVAKLRETVEYYTDMRVFGVVANDPDMQIEERHLGLMPSNESGEAEQQIARIRDLVAEQVDLGGVLALGKTPSPQPFSAQEGGAQKGDCKGNPPVVALRCGTTIKACGYQGGHRGAAPTTILLPSSSQGREGVLNIAICQDPAFGFYYPGDLEALEQAGAKLIPVNTLTDSALPEEIDGLFIGGGFPETHMQQLAANHSLRQCIHAAIEAGLPTYAECGGLMYLSRSLTWEGQWAAMVGIIPGDVIMHDRPQGRGYVKLQETADMPWPDGNVEQTINAHEFHYSSLSKLTRQGRFAYRMLRGTGIDGKHDGWVYKNLLASYTHMRHTGQFPWAQRFVAFIRSKRKQLR